MKFTDLATQEILPRILRAAIQPLPLGGAILVRILQGGAPWSQAARGRCGRAAPARRRRSRCRSATPARPAAAAQHDVHVTQCLINRRVKPDSDIGSSDSNMSCDQTPPGQYGTHGARFGHQTGRHGHTLRRMWCGMPRLWHFMTPCRALIQFTLPRSVLISPLCASIRIGCMPWARLNRSAASD